MRAFRLDPTAPFATALIVPALIAALGLASFGAAQEPYRLPPPEIVSIVDEPPAPVASLDPTGATLLLAQGRAMPTIDDMAEPMVALAGYRLNPETNGRHNPTYYVSLQLMSVADGSTRDVELPTGARAGMPRWSPDGKRFAFAMYRDDGIELWAGDTASAGVRRLGRGRLNETVGSAIRWMPDNRQLLCRFVPDDRAAPPERARRPVGPVIQETESGRVSQVRTYQDMLTDPHDEALFEHLTTAQATLVDTETGDRQAIGRPAIFISLGPSPDGRFLFVSRAVHPYSYQVPARSFPAEAEIWNVDGTLAKHLTSHPLRDTTPIGGVPTGPRSYQWRATADATLIWAEALDGGDPKQDAPFRDRLLTLEAPFDGTPRELVRTRHRYWNVSWLDGRSEALVSEYDRDRRWTRTFLFDVDVPARDGAELPEDTHGPGATRLVWDRSTSDRYGDPGRPLSVRLPSGFSATRVEDGAILLSGGGATPEGDRPFLHRMDLATFETEELWRCTGEQYETIVDVLADGAATVITRSETPVTPPNYFVRHGAERRALTDFTNPVPELADVHKELVHYERDDGVPLSATLYLPPGYDMHAPDRARLPLLVWAYPREFTGADVAGQVSGSPYRYTRMRGSSHLFMLTQGWAIMDAAAMPVIGDPETVNETFIEQIVAAAQAAIDKADELGVGDPERVAAGGHSYGAFMTAHLLAHCDLFKAGIARSGAYNRTLTPFGFQSERRTLWEAKDTYFQISPFMHADKINEPLLMIHGQKDNNSGTFPIQSERLFHALRGHGATARLVMLPEESHGYRARESVLHVLAEQVEWLDRWVARRGDVSP